MRLTPDECEELSLMFPYLGNPTKDEEGAMRAEAKLLGLTFGELIRRRRSYAAEVKFLTGQDIDIVTGRPRTP